MIETIQIGLWGDCASAVVTVGFVGFVFPRFCEGKAGREDGGRRALLPYACVECH